jgi:hypothetical protein
MNDITRTETGALEQWMEPKMLIGRLNRLKEIQKSIMKVGVHYGKVPGCKQDSLWQPGSQVLNVAFGLGQEPIEIQEFRTDDEIRYRVKTRVFQIATGLTIAYGVGECSSSEDKYAWRRVTGPKEWEATADDKRRVKFSKDYDSGDEKETQQIRTNPADVANTILKMATKRSEIKGTINALAASEVFTQDIEDLPEGMDIERGKGKSQSTKPAVNPDDVRQADSNIVTGVFSKPGSKNGKSWVKYAIVIAGTTYSTFDEKIGKIAESLKGQPVEFTHEQKGEYKNILSIKRAEPPKQQEPAQESPATPGAGPTVEDSDAFATTILALAMQKGKTEAQINQLLQSEFSCGIATVPANLQTAVIDFLTGL